jgi:ATP-binding cassette subfamily F protein uup
MPHPLLQIDTLTKSFGDLLLFRDISFGIAEGDKIGLIARNGQDYPAEHHRREGGL